MRTWNLLLFLEKLSLGGVMRFAQILGVEYKRDVNTEMWALGTCSEFGG